jgi:hypothetical protein
MRAVPPVDNNSKPLAVSAFAKPTIPDLLKTESKALGFWTASELGGCMTFNLLVQK